MKTVTHPGFLLLFPEVRLFKRLVSLTSKSCIQDKNVCLKLLDFYFSVFFSQLSKIILNVSLFSMFRKKSTTENKLNLFELFLVW